MSNNPLLKDQSQLKKQALALLSKAIAKIILKFKLPREEFLISLDEKLVLEARRQDPDASNVTLSIRTGIDRRYIAKHLKGEVSRARPNKLTMILEDIHWVSREFHKSNKIPKFGTFKTFQSICEQRAPGSLTPNSILEELVRSGNIKDLGSKVELLDLNTKFNNNDISYSSLVATQINRTTDTIIFNLDTSVSDDKYVQRTIYSTQVNPDKFKDLHIEMKQKFKKYSSEITDLFVSFEEDVNVGTYPEYGFSFLEYQKRE